MIKCDYCLKDCNKYYLYDNNNILCEICRQDKWDKLNKEVHNLKQECEKLYSEFCSERYFNKENLESISDQFNKKLKSLSQLIDTFQTVNNAMILSKQEAIEYMRQNNNQQAELRHSEKKKIWQAEAEEDRKLRQQTAKTVSQKYKTVQDAENLKKLIEKKFNIKK
ncbi:MAG: hypothetical protein UH853_04115 [Muribaculaceae bacterium]|nr:hypothetical protein [Muribaculaceae bacterium]